ncbi:restriction endonuclease subunit S [Bacteroides caccae]|jgi:type I restriction enzyme S subunit|uniref:restriction endonuclease subunit S n=2 Tax=Bacteroides caccae TaxID=47678 RepID=UPI0001546FAA|nr:restriction endonuclease subunit S [Bacteroides caccae]ASM67181.1 type I restriction endonuclease [Bacteroides caccae]EDM20294.1 type I restriction modification DNA specificity domain protein [Bacteroides caccae ATCC 43185]PQL37509.1 type I restriction endonuclease [Bacteroides caccae]QQT79574.1 restriction endonuclease subunit S [Bacteroides caccae]QRP58544.1 restriction endonuclease subunit S [Bacteroides caccae]
MDTKKLRQKILNLAIHGKLVPQDPNDEPASVLLERIKAEKERLIKEGKIKRSKKPVKTSDTPHYQQVPFEVPDSWTWTTLGEISNYGDCNNVSIIDIATDEWILELEDLEKDTASIIQMLSKKERNIKGVRHKFDKGDVLYSKLRTYLNKVLVAPKTGYCTTEIIPFNSYCGISNFYLCHVLRSAYFLDYTQQCGYGVKMPRLSTNDACKGMIPLPPIAEQQRIVVEIEKWFALIDQVEQDKVDLQTTIKQTKSKILDLAIHGKLVPQDPNDKPAIELLKRINPDFTPCDNGHYPNFPFDIPKKWNWVTLGEIGKWQSGSTPSRLNKDYYNGDIPWLKTGDLNDGYITHIPEYITEKALNETSVKLNPTGSILMAMYGATIGKLGILTYPATTNQACCACEIYTGIEKEFLFYFLLSHRADFIKLGGGGAQPNISKEKIINTYIPLPPSEEQKRIVNAVNDVFAQLDVIMESL